MGAGIGCGTDAANGAISMSNAIVMQHLGLHAPLRDPGVSPGGVVSLCVVSSVSQQLQQPWSSPSVGVATSDVAQHEATSTSQHSPTQVLKLKRLPMAASNSTSAAAQRTVRERCDVAG